MSIPDTPQISGPAAAPVRPPVLDRAVLLMWIAIGLEIVNAAIGIALTDERDLVQYDETLGISYADQRALAYTILAFAIVMSLGLWTWMAIIVPLIWHRDVTRYVTELSWYRAQIQYRVSQMRGY